MFSDMFVAYWSAIVGLVEVVKENWWYPLAIVVLVSIRPVALKINQIWRGGY